MQVDTLAVARLVRPGLIVPMESVALAACQDHFLPLELLDVLRVQQDPITQTLGPHRAFYVPQGHTRKPKDKLHVHSALQEVLQLLGRLVLQTVLLVPILLLDLQHVHYVLQAHIQALIAQLHHQVVVNVQQDYFRHLELHLVRIPQLGHSPHQEPVVQLCVEWALIPELDSLHVYFVHREQRRWY